MAAAGVGDANNTVRESIQSWPGLHTLLRWRGQFSKVIAMDQLLNKITTPPDKTIVFILDVDLGPSAHSEVDHDSGRHSTPRSYGSCSNHRTTAL
jgi:hypothetical protein